MNLTDYEKAMFENFNTKLKLRVWYTINPDRPDYHQFIACIKKYIEVNNTLEFSNDYTKFKRIPEFKKLIEEFKVYDGKPVDRKKSKMK